MVQDSKRTLQGRRTGVGTTAEGDMIAALGLRYGTEEATDFQKKYIVRWRLRLIVRLFRWQKSVGLSRFSMPIGKSITHLSIG